jgi:hypothetical protein
MNLAHIFAGFLLGLPAGMLMTMAALAWFKGPKRRAYLAKVSRIGNTRVTLYQPGLATALKTGDYVEVVKCPSR